MKIKTIKRKCDSYRILKRKTVCKLSLEDICKLYECDTIWDVINLPYFKYIELTLHYVTEYNNITHKRNCFSYGYKANVNGIEHSSFDAGYHIHCDSFLNAFCCFMEDIHEKYVAHEKSYNNGVYIKRF